ncbi:MAG: 3-oxoacyl-[acyl-carrier protein] reductase [Acidimicrobiaceae bacterium]|jgi:NAD(P)-dependent dehydrogenase (short-subunit alcohol dehydrogenase family)
MGHLEDRAGLNGRVAIIVGGGGGLGRACALDLGRAGMRLGLCDRNADLLTETTAMLAAEGVEVVTATIDARDDDALRVFFEAVDAAFGGRLHVLANVVGGTFNQPFEESTPKGWDAIIRTNFTWLLHAIQLAIPRMRIAGGGSIINFTSIEAHRAAPSFAVYAGMKAAITNTGRTLALELAPDGIRVNAIAADITPTEGIRSMLEGRSPEDERAADLASAIAIPMGRVGTYDDIGGCALFLASDLSRFVTGQTLHPDGGALASSGWFNWPDAGWRNTPPTEAVLPFLDPPP